VTIGVDDCKIGHLQRGSQPRPSSGTHSCWC